MSALNLPAELDPRLAARTGEILAERCHRLWCRVDQNFAILMLCQWIAAIVIALFVSPLTWTAALGSIHPHVWLAVVLGGTLTALPVVLASKKPGHALTRQAVAICQMLMSALLIQVTGGRLETHFHVFGSLAFLASYRDCRVLITASVIVAVDHFLRGVYWPWTVFDTVIVSPWRWIEHTGWVVFEDIFLLISIRQLQAEMLGVATRQAKLEAVKDEIESQVTQRTVELADEIRARMHSEEELRRKKTFLEAQADSCLDGVLVVDGNGRKLLQNRKLIELWNIPAEVLANPDDHALLRYATDLTKHPESFASRVAHLYHHPEIVSRDEVALKDGRFFDRYSSPVFSKCGSYYGRIWTFRDITDRKRAEEERNELNRRLVDASREAGMAEVATSVLHNVGNVLNSVNISIGIAAEKAALLKSDSLARVATILDEHKDNLAAFFAEHPQGIRLPNFLRQLATHLHGSQQTVIDELASLQKNIEHINEVVAMQQSRTFTGGVIETLPLHEIVADALRINAMSFEHHDVRVTHEFDESLLPASIDRNKLLLILMNLLRNAKHACNDGGAREKLIAVRTRQEADGTAEIAVIDNGIGIPPENFVRIFEHGFTTRKEGHGFGLHSSAIAAIEMGGSLRVHSDGLGHGATFTLRLPLQSTQS